MREGYGKCDDRATLLVMALRAMGIPAAFELVPYWGSSNNAHSFGTLVLPDDSIIPFQNDDNTGEADILHRKTPKVYRKMYSRNTELYNHEENLPELFRSYDCLDVTCKHRFGHLDIALPLEVSKGLTYLSVFSPDGWVPVACSPTKEFTDVGTGRLPGDVKEADDLGDGILYLPSRYVRGEM